MNIKKICLKFFTSIRVQSIGLYTDTRAEAESYKKGHRNVVPGVYNMALSNGRTTSQSQLLTTQEYNKALNCGFSDMNHRFEIKKERLVDEISDLRRRCAFDDFDDSDVEFIRDTVDGSTSESDDDIAYEVMMPQPNIVICKADEDNAPENAESTESVNDDVSTTNAPEPSTSMVNSDKSHAAKPIATNAEDDIDIFALSGSLVVEKTDMNDLVYRAYGASLRNGMAKLLVSWNKNAPFNEFGWDKKFIGVLYREVFRGRPNEKFSIGMEFLKRLFAVRVRVNQRSIDLEDFDGMFNEIHESKQQKTTKK